MKYRGRRIDNNQYVYGYWVKTPITDENSGTNPDTGHFFLTGEPRHCIVTETGVAYVVDQKTIAEATGMFDKHNKEVYSDDQVLATDSSTGETFLLHVVKQVSPCEVGYHLSSVGWNQQELEIYVDADTNNTKILNNMAEGKSKQLIKFINSMNFKIDGRIKYCDKPSGEFWAVCANLGHVYLLKDKSICIETEGDYISVPIKHVCSRYKTVDPKFYADLKTMLENFPAPMEIESDIMPVNDIRWIADIKIKGVGCIQELYISYEHNQAFIVSDFGRHIVQIGVELN